VLLVANACHVWKPAELGPTHGFINGRTRIERTDGSSVIVRGPRLDGDSVVGTHATTQARVTLPYADVRRVEVQRISRGRTALVGAGLLVLYWGIQAATISDSPDIEFTR